MIKEILKRAKNLNGYLNDISEKQKSAVLKSLAEKLIEKTPEILAANKLDLEKMSQDDPKYARLELSTAKIKQIAESCLKIAETKTYNGKVLYSFEKENGMKVEKIAVPIGVIGVIYEARPNVTIDVFTLAFKSGNVVILKGGSDAYNSNKYIVKLLREILEEHNLEADLVQLLSKDRSEVLEVLKAKDAIDIVIPRGSRNLIDFVRENAEVPVIETGAGVCHTYVHKDANLEMAVNLAINAKVRNPAVCNSLDCLLVDKEVYQEFRSLFLKAAAEKHIKVFEDKKYLGQEFLALKCCLIEVSDFDEALALISKYGSGHSETIVTEDSLIAEKFLNKVDAAAVYHNVSTAFTDGGEFGLGAEIGISTQKLHARGPFALEKLLTEKWIIKGNGQTR
jgi:glutamate-5-semialdehyde dehydrogenase